MLFTAFVMSTSSASLLLVLTTRFSEDPIYLFPFCDNPALILNGCADSHKVQVVLNYRHGCMV